MLELALHILDIIENSIRAGASAVAIDINENTRENRLVIVIQDNGSGMDEKTLKKALDPFMTTKSGKRIGLGLSLLAAAAHKCGGDLQVESIPDEGTRVTATFELDHVDRQPMGDLKETILILMIGQPHVDFILNFELDGKEWSWNTTQICDQFGDKPRTNPEIMKHVRNELKFIEACQ